MWYSSTVKNPTPTPKTLKHLDRAMKHWKGIHDSRRKAAAHIYEARQRGMTLREIADVMGCSVMTVKRLSDEAKAAIDDTDVAPTSQ